MEEFDIEWNNLKELIYDKHAFLDAIHVFIIANIIRRPIIIYGSPNIKDIQENNMIGIYLPLLWKGSETDKNPITIYFTGNHFMPLIPCDINIERYFNISLMNNDNTKLLPLKFLNEEENKLDPLELCQKYITVEKKENFILSVIDIRSEQTDFNNLIHKNVDELVDNFITE